MQQGGNPYGVQLFPVKSPSGAIFHVQTLEESDWYDHRRDQYLAHNHFVNISDLEDMDRLLMFELMVYRWSLWATQGFDYLYARVEENALKNNIREYSVEIRQIKAALGIDKVNRDKDKGENFGEYLRNFLIRAKEFGYHRNKQYAFAVTSFWKLHAIVRVYKRTDEQERVELGLTPEKIIEIIDEEMLKPFDKIEQDYRKNQAIWVRDPGAAVLSPTPPPSAAATAVPVPVPAMPAPTTP